MKIMIELAKETLRPEQLKELNNEIEKHMVEFYNLIKVMKEYEIRRSLYEKCKC